MRLADEAAILRERPFRLLFSAQTASVVGDNFTTVALPFAVLDLTGSASDLGIVLAARTTALMALLLVGGVWADRLSRRRVMVWSNLVRCASQVLLGTLLLAGVAQLWHLVALFALHGAATAFFLPASNGLLPEIVSAGQLQRANALTSVSESAGAIVGPALAGALVVATSPGWAIGIDALTFLLSATLLLRLEPSAPPPKAPRAFLRELTAGWGEVRARTWLWASLLHFALFQATVLSAFYVLAPLVAHESLGGAAAWGTILTATGVGSVLGGFFAMRFHSRRPLASAYVVSLGVLPGLELLGLGAPLWMLAGSQMLAGAALALAATLWDTVQQRHIPMRALSRVGAYDWMATLALRPVGLAVAGPMVAAMGVRATLAWAGLLVALSTVVLLSLPCVRHLKGGPEF